MNIIIALIISVVINYIIIGIIVSILGNAIFAKANMKTSGFIKFVYCLLWPIFIKTVLPGYKDVVTNEIFFNVYKSILEKLNASGVIENPYTVETGQLVGNEVTPDNVNIPQDAIMINESEEDNAIIDFDEEEIDHLKSLAEEEDRPIPISKEVIFENKEE